MGYNCHNFCNGQVLDAEALNEMEKGIQNSVMYTAQKRTPEQKALARENIGACRVDDSAVGGDAWSSKNIVDKLCPSFTESGAIVSCEPIAGYPLEVTAEDGATITQSGKNLARYPYTDTTKTVNGITFTDNGDGTITANGTATANANFNLGTQSTWALKPGADYTASINQVSGTATGTPGFAVNYYKPGASAGGYSAWLSSTVNKAVTKPCPADYASVRSYINIPSGCTCTDLVLSVQLEAGTIATNHVPYRESKTYAQGELIPAFPGVNTLNADSGIITVTGKANPSAIIEKLSATVAALTGV